MVVYLEHMKVDWLDVLLERTMADLLVDLMALIPVEQLVNGKVSMMDMKWVA